MTAAMALHSCSRLPAAFWSCRPQPLLSARVAWANRAAAKLPCLCWLARQAAQQTAAASGARSCCFSAHAQRCSTASAATAHSLSRPAASAMKCSMLASSSTHSTRRTHSAAHWSPAADSLSRHQAAKSRQVATAAAGARVSQPRPSKSASKRDAQRWLDAARQLTSLTEKQLAALAGVLPAEVLEAIPTASRLPRRNQARARQEGLIGRLLRELEDNEQARVQAYLERAAANQGAVSNPDAERLATSWRDALVAESESAQAAWQELHALPREWGLDLQQLRQLARQAAQQGEADRSDSNAALTTPDNAVSGASAEAADDGSGSGSAAAAADAFANREGGEGLASARMGAQAPGRGRKNSASTRLLRALRPIAERRLQEGAGNTVAADGSDEEDDCRPVLT